MDTKNHNVAVNFVGGALGGALAKTIMHPFERAKLLVARIDPAYLQGLKTKDPERYRQLVKDSRINTISVLSRVAREEGMQGLWRGNLLNVMRYLPIQGLNFAYFGLYRNLLPSDSPATLFCAGALAGVTQILPMYPFDIARMEWAIAVSRVRNGLEPEFSHGSIKETLKDIYQKKGITRLYRGGTISLSGVAVYRGIYFGAYCGLRHKIGSFGDYFIPRFALAWATTCTASLASYPLDHIRRRQHTSKAKLVEVIKTEFTKGGLKGFFAGAVPTVFSRCIAGALTLCLFDTFL